MSKLQQGHVDNLWNTLCTLGLPLLQINEDREQANVEDLPNYLYELTSSCQTYNSERKIESLKALLLALKIHFPTYYRDQIQSIDAIDKLLSEQPTGRIIKLKRLAERILANMF